MKKISPFIVLLFLTMILSGCSQAKEETTDNNLSNNAQEVDTTITNNEDLGTENEEDDNESEANEEADNESKNYVNEELGFEFNLPEGWVIDEDRTDAQTVVFMQKDGMKTGESREAITAKDNASNLSLEQVVDEFVKSRKPQESTVNKDGNFNIGQAPVIKVETNEFGLSHYFFLHGKKVYQIETQGNLFSEAVLKTMTIN